MTRKNLGSRNGERFRVTATVERFGQKNGWRGKIERTVLLKDLRDADSGGELADHLWFTCGAWSAVLREGDHIAFTARGTRYEKGYRGRREDAWDAPPPSFDWRLEVKPGRNLRELKDAWFGRLRRDSEQARG